MTLTKRELGLSIGEQTGLSQAQVFDAAQKTLHHIFEALAKGEKVEFCNFGKDEGNIRKIQVSR